MIIRTVETELFHVDGQKDRQVGRRTDMTKLVVAIRNFVNAPKNQWLNTSQGSSRCLLYESCGTNIRNFRKYGAYTDQNILSGWFSSSSSQPISCSSFFALLFIAECRSTLINFLAAF
jgi:hypothetical protein